MSGSGRRSWRGLAVRLTGGVLAAVLVVIICRLVRVEVDPIPAVIMGLLVGSYLWLAGWFERPDAGPSWRQPQPLMERSRLSADVRTNRIATMLVHSRPGEDFESSALTRKLAELAESRLVRNHHVPADDPLAHADGRLSAPLLAHLRSERPPALKRATLRAYLKEIDDL